MHVVIVAYGPRASTRRAVVQARRWGDQVSSISVVPAGPISDVGAGTFDGVHVPAAGGTIGVREAAGDGPVLLIHDDVRLDGGGMLRMTRGLERSDYAVQHAIDGRRPPLICVAARNLEPIATSLVLPGVALQAADAVITPVDVNARHDNACRQRLVADSIHRRKPLLVASMIVRDEEASLPDALRSVAGLVDRIDICDTGSVDRTREVILRHRWRRALRAPRPSVPEPDAPSRARRPPATVHDPQP